MKKNLPSFSKNANRVILLTIISFIFQSICGLKSQAQIIQTEGINMPGSWNAWLNPPANNLAFANSMQVTNGRIIKMPTGASRWQTIFSVAASGADLSGGSYQWKFTSGPLATPSINVWSDVTVAMNQLQSYTFHLTSGTSAPPPPPSGHGGNTNYAPPLTNNNSVVLTNGKWYTVNWEDIGYINCRAIFMQTSAQPVSIASVSLPGTVIANTAASITVSTSQPKSPDEIIYLRYSTDGWITSTALPVAMSGSNGSVLIPGQVAGTTVAYYAFSSTLANLSADFDLCSIKVLNNAGANYSYTVEGTPIPVITWANLQLPASGSIETGQAFNVFGQALIPGLTGQAVAAPGLQAWIGYSSSNSSPETWPNWIQADYTGAAGSYDVFKADLGSAIPYEGIYYYATRFQLNSGPYLYGGYSTSGGGFWDGINNVSGELTITNPLPGTFPVLFTIIDGTLKNTNIKLKGDMTAWLPVSMTNLNHTWTLTRDLAPGTYQWGAIEDDGTSGGIWLIDGGGNLSVNVSATGNISGTVTYTTLITGLDEPASAYNVFPNPTSGPLFVNLPVRGIYLISDMMGKNLLQGNIEPGNQHIDMGSCSPGLYHLEIRSANFTRHYSLVRK